MGPLQVVARRHCPKRWGLPWCSYDGTVTAGVAYLREMVDRYGLAGGLARYRTGGGNYRSSERWRQRGDDYAERVLGVARGLR